MSNNKQQPVSEYGGKGSVLLHLKEEGYPVPKLVVLPVSFTKTIADQEHSTAAINPLIKEWQILFGEDALLAVRSSATVEDSTEQSFAGQFSTLLNITFKDLPAAIHEVIQSGRYARVQAYAKVAGVSVQTEIAVIIQEMITATSAGVAFGINPLNGDDEIVINAVAGLGDKLVDGSANATTYVIKNNTIEGLDAALLEETQVKEIADCVNRLGKHFNHPQDIEFAFKNDTFYLLQSRPVTTKIQAERITWDNSNIVESYPGLTLPLTFSFIEKMYEAVYRQFSVVLGVSPSKVDRYSYVYANMLGLLNGRVYYNLNSWYRALAQLPGYSLNASFMEKMMGVKEKPDVDISKETNKSKLGSWRDVGFALYRIIKNLRNARKEKEQFIKAFDGIYNQYHRKDFSTLSPAAIWEHYSRFESLMLKEWKAPLVNDFFAMIYFGLLQKQCAKYWPDQKDLHNQLIAGSDDIITTEPLKQLPKLASLLAADPELKTICLDKDAAAVWQYLQQPEYASTVASINEYLDVWGERCVAELKLETVTYTQAPEKLIGILQTYIINNIFNFPQSTLAVAQRSQAEEIINRFLKGKYIKKRLFNHILKQARYFVSNRENLRYYRTKGFGMVRKMMMAIGEQWHQQGLLQQSRDIFYLKLQEIEQLIKAPYEMQEIIGQRKKDYELMETLPLPARVITSGKPDKMLLLPVETSAQISGDLLQGLPCSQGTVRSVIYKVDHASALRSLNGGILATYATDPGYVVLFATASGILTERGSLLSHAAIVSREMGIPCIVGIEGLMDALKDGDEIIMDGSTGIVKIINRA